MNTPPPTNELRYVYDDEPARNPGVPVRLVPSWAAELRRELSARNVEWAQKNSLAHEVSTGSVPAVLYRQDERGRHGNFHPSAYTRIRSNPDWSRRLNKVHTSARRILVTHDASRCELDSSNSSDALLMSIFCHPQSLKRHSALHALLGSDAEAEPTFGYRPRIPLASGRTDTTEIDMRLGSLLFEAKLTEYDFQTAPLRLIERYRDLNEVFRPDELPQSNGLVLCYQLVRGALAAWNQPDARFCVLCDARRPDLAAAWYRVLQCVRPPELRCRLLLLTWQEIAADCAPPLQRWLNAKYGITSS